jgi:hypothetical protein
MKVGLFSKNFIIKLDRSPSWSFLRNLFGEKDLYGKEFILERLNLKSRRRF